MELKTPDQILNRWVEMEFDDGYPANAHLIQVRYLRLLKFFCFCYS
jgi:hypothetical protein